jgi:hypothetical protein
LVAVALRSITLRLLLAVDGPGLQVVE